MPGKTARLTIKIKRVNPAAKLPKYEHPNDSGADLYAAVDCTLERGEWKAVSTGLCAEVPAGLELQLRPKSGLALQSGITVLNTPGTIDSGYRGEIKVILVNLGPAPYRVRKGQKIAQLVVAPVARGAFKEVTELSASARGRGGFGSTGLA